MYYRWMDERDERGRRGKCYEGTGMVSVTIIIIMIQ